MKAVIMAGGEGTRLRPVTSDLPKPMVQVLGRPVMEYTVELLKKHGITEIGSTLHFLPDAIRDWFGDGSAWGVNMHYNIEETPLGTAGSVRAMRDFLNETFIVISGDALTDIDLGLTAEFHRQKQADVTIVLKSVEAPVDFGVVISGSDGRVERFMEKPAWRDVFSDTVNTGIYIIEPQVMDRIAAGAKADFAKDLFPALMKDGAKIFGYMTEGYWCDIGNPQQYAAAQFDILDGRVRVSLPLPETGEGVFAHSGASIAKDARLVRPCAVLEGAVIEPGSTVGPYAVIGRGCAVGRGASLAYSILLDGARCGPSSRLERGIVCQDATIGERAWMQEGSIVGAGARVGHDAMLQRGVSVWPGITVEPHARVRSAQQRGSRYPQSLFDDSGISGAFNDDISAESAARIAMALGTTVPPGSRVGIAIWGDAVASLVRESFDAGLLSTGVCCVDLGELSVPAARFAARRLRLNGAVHIHSLSGKVDITLMDGKGANIDMAMERKIEDCVAKGSFRKAKTEDVESIIDITGISEFYSQELYGEGTPATPAVTVGVYGPDGELNQTAQKSLERAGYSVKACSLDGTIKSACLRAVSDGAHVSLFQQKGGDDFALIDEKGNSYEGGRLAVLLAMAAMDRGVATGTVPLPILAGSGFEALASGKGVQVERTAAGRSDWLRKACYSQDERVCHLFNDGTYAAMSVAETLANERMALSQYAARIPETFTHQQYVECPLEKRGLTMKTLYTQYQSTSAYGGALVENDRGSVFITPDRQSSRFKVVAQAVSQEFADELAGEFAAIISGLANS